MTRHDFMAIGPFAMNCYAVFCEQSKEAVIFDPGAEASVICGVLENWQPEKTSILLTHGHLDHIMAIGEVAPKFDAKVFVPAADQEMYDNLPMQCQMFGVPSQQAFKPYEVFEPEAFPFSLGSVEVECIATPGHSPGGCCFIFPKQKWLFSGDLLFRLSIGRTDLWGSNDRDMQTSLKRVLELPDDLHVFPGHGPTTTIGAERIDNPYLKGL